MAILKYAKSVAVSIGYTLPGVAGALFPDVKAIVDTVQRGVDAPDPVDTIRDATSILRRDVGQILRTGLDSVDRAVRTGEFNRPETAERLAASFGESLGIDPSVFDNSFLEEGATPDPAASAARAAAYGAAHGLAALSRSLTDSPAARVTAAATEASARLARTGIGASIAVGNQLKGAITASNELMLRMANFQATTQRAYYERSLEHLAASRNSLAALEAAAAAQVQGAAVGAMASDATLQAILGKKASDFTRVFGGAGGFNVAAYAEVVKRRLQEHLGAEGAYDMAKSFLAGAAADPVGAAAAEAVRRLFPGIGQLRQFNRFAGNLGTVVSERLGHAGRYLEDRGLGRADAMGLVQRQLGALLRHFDVAPSGSRPDLGAAITSRPVPYDGRAAHSIVEVIPNYLSHIHAEVQALRRAVAPGSKVQDRMVFDYGRGRMVSARASLAETQADALRASRAALNPVMGRLGALGDEDVAEGLAHLANSGLSFDRASSPAGPLGQMEAEALKAEKAGDRNAAGKIRAVKNAFAARLAGAGAADQFRLTKEMTAALRNVKGSYQRVYGEQASVGAASRSALSGGAGGFDLESAFAEETGLYAREAGRADAARAPLSASEHPREYHRPGPGGIFRGPDGRVTASSILRAPWAAVSRAMDYLESGISYALFGKSEGGGLIGRAKEFLLGPPGSGPGGQGRGGMFGAAYEYMLGKGRQARDFLAGKDGQKGFLGEARDRLNGAIAKVADTVRKFFYGDKEAGTPGFLERVVVPARDWVAREVWEPLKRSTLEVWREAGAFLRREVVEPLRGIFRPFVEEAKHQWENLKGWTWRAARAFGGAVDGSIKQSLGKGLGDMLRDNVLNPIKEALSSVRRLLGSAFSAIVRLAMTPLRYAADEVKVGHLRAGRGGYIAPEERERLVREHGLRNLPAQAQPAPRAAATGAAGGPVKPPGAPAAYQAYQGIGGQTVQAGVSFGAVPVRAAGPEAAARAAEGAAAASALEEGLAVRPPPAGGRAGAAAAAVTAEASTAALAAAVETAQHTKGIYSFMTRNLRGVSATLSGIARHMGVKFGGIGAKRAGGGDAGDGEPGGGGLLGRLRSLLASPARLVAWVAAGLAKGAFAVARKALKLPFTLLGKGIGLLNSTLGFVRKSMGNIFGFFGDALRAAGRALGGLTKGVFLVANQAVGLLAGTAVHLGTVLFGRADASGRRQGGIVPGLIRAGGQLTGEFLRLAGGVARLGLQFVKMGAEVVRTTASVLKHGVQAASSVIFGGFGAAAGAVTGAAARRGYSKKLLPVYVVGGYLASASGGAGSLAEAEAGLSGAAGRTARALGRGLRGALASARGLLGGGEGGESEEGPIAGPPGGALSRARAALSSAGSSLSGGFRALGARLAQTQAAKTVAEWRHRMLSAGEGSEAHLGAIRRGFGAVGELLMAAVPAIAGALGGIWEFFRGGRLVSALAHLLPFGGRAAGAAAAGGAAAGAAGAGAAAARPISRLLARVPGGARLAGALGRITGSRLGGAALRGAGLGRLALGAGAVGLGVDFLADTYLRGGARTAARSAGTALQYGALGAEIGSLAGPEGTVAGAAVGAAAGLAVENWGRISGALSGTARALGGLGKVAVGAFLGAGSLAAGAEKAVAGALRSAPKSGIIRDFGELMLGPAGAAAGLAGAGLASGAASGLAADVRAAFLGSLDPSQQGSKSMLDVIWGSVSSTLSDWGKALGAGLKGAGSWLQGAGAGIAQAAGQAGSYVSAAASTTASYVRAAGQAAGSFLGGAPGQAVSAAASGAASGIQAGGAGLGGAVSYAGGAVGGAASYGGRAISAAGAELQAPPSVAQVQDIIKKAARRVGVDPALMLAIAQQESSFRPGAGAATSSARGLYQFVDGTWSGVVGQFGAKDGVGYGQILDPMANALMGAEFEKQNIAVLKRALGRDPTATEVYAAHFLGPGDARSGAVAFLRALAKNPGASASALFPAAAAANPSIFNGQTLQGVYNFLYDRVGAPAEQYARALGQAPARAPSRAAARLASSAGAAGARGPAARAAPAAAMAGPAAMAAAAAAPAPASIQQGQGPGMAQQAAVDQSLAQQANDNAPAQQAAAAAAPGGGGGGVDLTAVERMLAQIAQNTGSTVQAIAAAAKVQAAAAAAGSGGGQGTFASSIVSGRPGSGSAPQMSPVLGDIVRRRSMASR